MYPPWPSGRSVPEEPESSPHPMITLHGAFIAGLEIENVARFAVKATPSVASTCPQSTAVNTGGSLGGHVTLEITHDCWPCCSISIGTPSK